MIAEKSGGITEKKAFVRSADTEEGKKEVKNETTKRLGSGSEALDRCWWHTVHLQLLLPTQSRMYTAGLNCSGGQGKRR